MKSLLVRREDNNRTARVRITGDDEIAEVIEKEVLAIQKKYFMKVSKEHVEA